MLDALVTGTRLALRSLTRHRTFAAFSVLTIAIAIGANVAIFSVVESVLIRPLPFRDPSRLILITGHVRVTPAMFLIAPADLADMRGLSAAFEGVEGSSNGLVDMVLGLDDGALLARAERVTPGIFGLLGVSPMLGAGFDVDPTLGSGPGTDAVAGEEAPEERPEQAVIAYELWERAFGRDPDIVGRSQIMNGSPVTIVGVMPPRFAIPRLGPTARGYDVELWFPIREDPSAVPRPNRSMLVLARLRDGATVEQARAALRSLSTRLQEQEAFYDEAGIYFEPYPTQEEIARPVRAQLTVLLGAVGLLLLLAAGNVSCLLMARSHQRGRETAVMLALGCPRTRMIGHRFAETVLLSVLGGSLGLALGWLGTRGLERIRPPDFPAVTHVSMDGWVIAYAVGAMTLATVLAGILPALTDSRLRSGLALRTAGLLESARGARRWMAGLVVFETALSVTLLFGALLLVRTAVAIYGERPGFDVDRTLAFQLRMDVSHPEPGVREATLRRLRAELGALPGVDAVGAANILPFSGELWNTTFWWDEESREIRARADLRVATPGFFEAMGTRLVAGRDFAEAEPATSVIVDASLARQAWPSENPVGRALWVRGAEHAFTVVGVSEHIRHAQLHEDGRPTIYFTYALRPRTAFGVVLHTSVPPASLVNTVRQVVASVDPTLFPYRIAPLRDAALRSVSTTRYVVILLSGFALTALTLAVVGLYGVLAYGVRLRLKELGIRMALGATGSAVFTRVVAEAVALAAVGLAVGWGAAVGLTGLVESLLYGVAPTDPATFGGTAVVLLGAAAVAGGIPAWRAARIDPNAILKAD